MDISGTYDNVTADRLSRDLKRKGVPRSLVGWTRSFVTDREASLLFDGRESSPISVDVGIPQGSPVSPILFLFYNAELLEIGNAHAKVTALGFVDDVNLVAVGKSTEANCRALRAVHDECEM